jgi:membrane protease YdiL (CAAX protease family)
MVVLTHLAYGWLSALIPGVHEATRALLKLLNVVGFTPAERAGLIVVIASCEELLFRGPLPALVASKARPAWRWPVRSEVTRLLAFAAVYALTTVPLGSPLLVVCAFACGSVWGTLRIASGSLVAPILTHVIWDLGVLLIWPLASA